MKINRNYLFIRKKYFLNVSLGSLSYFYFFFFFNIALYPHLYLCTALLFFHFWNAQSQSWKNSIWARFQCNHMYLCHGEFTLHLNFIKSLAPLITAFDVYLRQGSFIRHFLRLVYNWFPPLTLINYYASWYSQNVLLNISFTNLLVYGWTIVE